MKFGTLIELKMLYRMTPRSFQSDTIFKVTVNDLEFDLENNVKFG